MSREPILVTGIPRSGTTWLARLLATAPGTALAGREPMNPRGRQYALGGTLDGWTRLVDPSPRQRRVLRSTYRGLNPRTYGKYGRHQWRAPLPSTRVVVKDPFAMLSVPCVSAVTGARAVQLYRHPGAVLSSYRRMGWRPDLPEIAPYVAQAAAAGNLVHELAAADREDLSDAEQMGVFWSVLTTIALDDLEATPGAVLVAHHELAAGGVEAVGALFASLGLRTGPETALEMRPEQAGSTGSTGESATALHRFDRDPAQVAMAWTKNTDPEDVARIEEVTAATRERVQRLRLVLTP